MEPTPEQQYKAQEPNAARPNAAEHSPAQQRVWQVGDLVRINKPGYKHHKKRALILEAGGFVAEMICEDGHGYFYAQSEVKHLHNTGLTYRYQNRKQVQRDYQAGVFTAYFDAL